MQSSLAVSFWSFGLEGVLFVGACYFVYARHRSRGLARLAWILVALTALAGAVALDFPLRFVHDHASALRNAHPLILAVLIGAPLMPVLLLALGALLRRR